MKHLKSTIFLLGSTVVVAAILRGWQAGESLWLDELHTSWAVNGSLGEVVERAAIGNQSPLYFWLAWFFARLPMQPEIALRMPSLLAGCALPVALYWLTSTFTAPEKPTAESADHTPALLAAWLVAIDPQAIFYSQEARPYALMMLVAVVHIGQLFLILRRTSAWARPLWVLTGALLVHLNYTGGLLLIAELVAIVILGFNASRISKTKALTSRNEVLDVLLKYWIDVVVLVILLLPAIPSMLDVASRRDNWTQFVKPQDWFEMFRVFPWTPAIILLIVLNSWRAAVSQRVLVLLVCWLLVPIGFAWLTTQLHLIPLFHQRYLIVAMPAALMAAALCVRLTNNSALQSILIGLVLAMGVANGGLVRNWRQDGRILHERREDWRAAISALNLQLDTYHQVDIPVLVRSGLIEADSLPQNSDRLFREYCLCPVRGMYRLRLVNSHPLTTHEPGKLSGELRKLLKLRQSFWLLVRTSQASVREQLLVDLRQSIEGEEIWEPDPPIEFGNLYIQRVQLRKPLLPASQ
jgi:mannosyltransferase